MRVRRRDDGSVATRENSTFSGSNLMSVFSNAGIPGGTSAAELRRGVRNHVVRMTTSLLLRASVAAEPNSNVMPEHLDVALAAMHPPALVITGRRPASASPFLFDALGKDEEELHAKMNKERAEGENSQDADFDAAEHDSDDDYASEEAKPAPAKPPKKRPSTPKKRPAEKPAREEPPKKRKSDKPAAEAPAKPKVSRPPAISRPPPATPRPPAARPAAPAARDDSALYSMFD